MSHLVFFLVIFWLIVPAQAGWLLAPLDDSINSSYLLATAPEDGYGEHGGSDEIPKKKRRHRTANQKKTFSRQPSQESERAGPTLTWDLGASAGSMTANDQTFNYFEAQLGLNYFLMDWLAWRNAVFYRFYSESIVEDYYGWDTMARFYYRLQFFASSGLVLFGGPGFRFQNIGKNVPFAEAGLVVQLLGLRLGGGVRTFFNDWVDDTLGNDTQYFLVLGGSGAF